MSAVFYEYNRPGHGLLIVTLVGFRATLHDAGTFRDTMLREIEDGNKIIILNFGKVEFIDSTFLGALVVVWKKVTSLNGGLVLTNLNSKVKDTFTLTQLDKKLSITDSVEDALLLFKAKD